MFDITTLVLIAFAYLLGSMSSAVIVCNLMGLPDPRTQGSNNPGATNVLRIGGKKAAIITLLSDVLKGIIPVLIAHAFNLSFAQIAFVGVAAFLGHVFPVFFGFRGGKGVATAVGVAFATHLYIGLIFGAIWLASAAATRYSSLSALLASLSLAVTMFWLSGSNVATVIFAVMTVTLWFRHHRNIKNLLDGREHKIGQK